MSSGWWAAVAVATPVLSFLAVLLGHAVTRRGDVERDVWRRREETMRTLRWAVEVATSADPVRAEAGLATLEALLAAELLQPQDRDMVQTVAEVVLNAASAVAHGAAGPPAAGDDTAVRPQQAPVSRRQVRAAGLAVRAAAALGREPDPSVTATARSAG